MTATETPAPEPEPEPAETRPEPQPCDICGYVPGWVSPRRSAPCQHGTGRK